MAKLKLPGQLKSWKVFSEIPDNKSYPSFNVVKTEFDGSQTAAVLTYVCFEGDDYSSEHVDLVNEEAAFVKNLIKLHSVSNYIDAVVDNEPSESRISLYLLKNDAQPLMKIIGGKQPDDSEIVDFGLQISEILDKLEKNNILHGNLKPENVFINAEGQLLLSGFTAFDNNAQDLSYTAPELADGGQPDYTTDIYSLGLMMYAMANGGKLPFESETVNRAAATQKRLSKTTVPAPSGGNEKLKSVVVIACQPENKNRWKNAGNIKNALASIKAELPAQAKPVRKPAAPANTAFESNMFEEYAFDEVEDPSAVTPEPEAESEKTAHELAQDAVVAASVAALASQAAAPEASGSASASDADIDNRVFDNYEPQTKVFKINDAQANDSKNYGDLFEDEAPAEAPKTSAPVNAVPPVAPVNDNFEGNNFYKEEEPEPDDQEPAKKSKGFVAGVIIVIVAVLIALAAVGALAYQNGWLPFKPADKQQSSAATTAPAETAAPTTAPATTAPATTVPSTTQADTTHPATVTPVNVVGYFYDYAIEVLEAQGFTVDFSERVYSDDWAEGFVISMSPTDSESVQYGSEIKIVVSRGPEHPTTESRERSSSESDESSSSDSDSADSSSSDGQSSSAEADNVSVRGNSTPNSANTNNTNNSGSRDAVAAANTSGTAKAGSASVAAAPVSSYKNNTSYLTQSEVDKMSREELNLALNEIYARRGRIFKTTSLASYFQSQSWYKPLYSADEFNQKVVLNDYENQNISLIRDTQIKKGYI